MLSFQPITTNLHILIVGTQSEVLLKIYPPSTANMTITDIVTDPFLQSVLETSSLTRQRCTALLDLVEAHPTSTDAPLPNDIQYQLSTQQKILFTHLSQLRGLNRDAILGVRQTKQVTAEARHEIDRLHLHLQNLYYEQRHLRGEIHACESYE